MYGASLEKGEFSTIWALLSRFEKAIALDEILKYPLSYTGFWKNPISIQ